MEFIYENSNVSDNEISKYGKKIIEAHEMLHEGTGEGSGF